MGAYFSVGYFTGALGPSGYGSGSTADQIAMDSVDSIKSRNFIVTGANSGLGKSTSGALAAAGAHVYMVGRSLPRLTAAAEEIHEKNPDAQLTPMVCDLADLDSVRAFVSEYKNLNVPLHGLVNNAAVMACPLSHTKQGHEMQFGVNHYGHALLTLELLDLLKKSGTPELKSRIVCVSSFAHRLPYPEGIRFDDLEGTKHYNPWQAYGQSKLANALFSSELARRLENDPTHPNVLVNSMHPGAIKTELGRHNWYINFLGTMFAPLWKTPAQGAATEVFLVAHPYVTTSGKYYESSNVSTTSKFAEDPDMAARLWKVTQAALYGETE